MNLKWFQVLLDRKISMNKKAFTLLEVLVALLILVSVVTIFSNTQLRSFLRSIKSREFLDRVFIVRSELDDLILKISMNEKYQKKEVKNIENPLVRVTKELINIDKKSTLSGFNENIKIVKSSGSWTKFGNTYDLPIITFIRDKNKKEK